MSRHTIIKAVLLLIAALTLAAFLIYASLPSPDATTLPPEEPGPTTLSSPPATAPLPRSLSGFVLRSDGQPIPGATITATRDDERLTATSDELGQFAFPPLAVGTWAIDAAAQGYVSPGPEESRAMQVELPSEDAPPLTDIELVLRQPAQITGLILANKNPLPGARISLLYMFADGIAGPIEPFSLDTTLTSAAQGQFDTGPIAPGRVRLLIEAPGFAFTESRELLLREQDRVDDFSIDLAQSATVSFKTTDSQGNPVAAALVLSGASIRPRRLQIPPQGLITLSDLPAEPLTLTASAPGFRSISRPFTPSLDGPTQIDLVLEAAAGLFGKVVDADGAPVQGAAVQILNASATSRPVTVRTDPEGRFQFAPNSAGAWTARAYSSFHAPSQSAALRDGEELLLTLSPGGFIAGQVLTQRGAPVQSYRVAVEDVRLDTPRFDPVRTYGTLTINNASGQFELGPLAPGTYYLRAQPNNYADATSGPIVVTSSTTTRGVTLRVAEAGSLTGLITSTEGQPLVGVTVELFDPLSPFPQKSARTDAQGRYSIEGVPPGRRSVRAALKGYTTRIAAGLTLTPGQTLQRDLTLEPSTGGEQFSFHGIGAILSQDDQGILIRETLQDSPSALSGLQQGDRIRSVDGEDVGNLRLTDVIERIRGEEGVPVTLEVDREGEGRVRVEVSRGQVKTSGTGR